MTSYCTKTRRGAVAPLFALVLPILFVLSGFAINVAYMQLVASEMKIATDAAAHAGGRAMSIHQTTEEAIELARAVGEMNWVAGRPLSLTTSDADADIVFGKSIRVGNGRYTFERVSQTDVDSGAKRATSVGVLGSLEVPLLFMTIPGAANTVNPSRRSIATQVDRDIALVLDRSGSMLYYQDETALTAALKLLKETMVTTTTTTRKKVNHPKKVAVQKTKWVKKWVKVNGKWKKKWVKKTYTVYEWQDNWVWEDVEETTERPAITQQEYNDATEFLYDRRYSQNVINQLATISSDMSEYTNGWQSMINSSSSWSSRSPAPQHSRWAFAVDGVDAFLDVLEKTDQNELVSLVTFASSASLDLTLQGSYDSIRNRVADIVPYSGTAIGEGLLTGLPPIISGDAARPFASKTIVVMTDGENNNGTDPVTAVKQAIADNAVTIHAVTFATDNADALKDMDDVAKEGNGKHYHAADGFELIDVFEEIANNLPTILTE